MNKKYIKLFIVVIVLFVIFIGVLVFQQSQSVPTPSTLQGQNPAKLHQPSTGQTKVMPAVTLSALSNSPEEAVKQFYNYYFAASQNPLADGGYKSNPYLSQQFKDTLGALYNNGNTPVFCPQNKRTNITVGQGVQIYYGNQYMTQEVISDASSGKNLYRVILENNNNKWLIFDVNCIY